jgi:CRP/FNR family transcriptional regulator, cyclic AMP receptor protein
VNEEQQVELLSGVDIFEDLPKEEVREILDDLLKRHAVVNLGAGEVFYTPRQPDGKLFILKRGRVRVYKMEASREFTLEVVEAGTVFGEVAFTPTPSGTPTPRPPNPPYCWRWSARTWSA